MNVWCVAATAGERGWVSGWSQEGVQGRRGTVPIFLAEPMVLSDEERDEDEERVSSSSSLTRREREI